MKQDNTFGELLLRGMPEIPDRNFEDRIMKKIQYVAEMQRQRRKNIRLSWLFLLFSLLLFPWVLILLSNNLHSGWLSDLGTNLVGIMLPAAILMAAILLLIQVDNLLSLTLRFR